MGTIRVWTKQNLQVLEALQQTGRHVAKKDFILRNDDSALMKPCYDWLVQALPQQSRPADADYPIWLSFRADATMLPTPGCVILELEIDEALITRLNVAKWGAINNFSYLPADEADLRRHRRLLKEYGISDAKACMSRFYPELRAEIEASWSRVFDDRVKLGNDLAYGLVWEVRESWIRSILR